MKNISAILLLSFLSIICFGQTETEVVYNTSSVVRNSGIGLGSIIAVVASWSRNKSILWAILHGFLSWLYLIYFVFTRSRN